MCENKVYSIRPLENQDAARMLEWMRDEEVIRHLRIGGRDTKLEDVIEFIKKSKDESENLHRAIVDESNVYLGTVSLKHIDRAKSEAEFAIAMHKSAWGTGAARQGTVNITKIAFDILGLKRIYLNVASTNERAIHFYNRCGFTFVGTTQIDLNGEVRDLIWYEKKNKL